MYVILDTCSINLDFHLSGRETKRLLAEAPVNNLVVCVSEIVVKEMARHFRKELSKTRKDFDTVSAKLAHYLESEPDRVLGADTVNNAIEDYERSFRERLEQHGVQIIPLSGAALDAREVLNRYVGGRRPFRESGVGLTDTLMWMSVLEMCRQGPRSVALVTNNTKDFADESGEWLHPHLLEELRLVGIPTGETLDEVPARDTDNPGDAELYKSIKEFNAARLGAESGPSETPSVAPGSASEPSAPE